MTITCCLNEQILIVTLTGKTTTVDAYNALEEASRMLIENNLPGILVDIREAELKLSTMEIYELCTSSENLFSRSTSSGY